MLSTASAVPHDAGDHAVCAGFRSARSGSREKMPAGFASPAREDAGMNVIFLRREPQALPAGQRADHAGGLTLAFTVDDLEGELTRLEEQGAGITMPLAAEDGGERVFQVRDAGGVIVQLLDWNAPAGD